MHRSILAFMILGASSASAQEPDPVAILRAADASISGANTIAYSFRRQCIGSLAARSPELTGTVAVDRIQGEDELGWRIALAGERAPLGDAPARSLSLAYDGTVLRAINEADMIVSETTGAGLTEVAGDDAWHAVKWLLRWDAFVSRPFGGDEALFDATYEGRAVVDGVECHIVFVELGDLPSAPEYDIRWFIGVDDNLPHRYDAYHYEFSGSPNGFEVFTIGDLRIDDPVLASAFTLDVPDGYEVKTVEVAAVARGRPQIPTGPAPDFTLTDTNGKEHTLKDYRGRVVVLDFGATWCPPCILAMPEVQALHERFEDKPVTVLGVNCWETGDMAAFMQQNQYDYTMLVEGDRVAGQYGVSSIPTFFVIGVDGKILMREVGFRPGMGERAGAIIERHLAENANE